MAEFSDKKFSSDTYNSARPDYPASFLEYVVDWHLGKNEQPSSKEPHGKEQVVLDIGCGTGQVAFPLRRILSKKLNATEETSIFSEVIGIDPSESMIKKCNEKLKQLKSDDGKSMSGKGVSLKFCQGFSEALTSMVKDQSVDLIVAAQCFHWFDYDKVFKEFSRILKPNGTLAYWFYVDPIIISKKDSATQTTTEVNLKEYYNLYNKYTYDDQRYLGPYWENPGRILLRDLCKSVKVPESLFKNVHTHYFELPATSATSTVQNRTSLESDGEKLLIKRYWTLQEYRGYVYSWSSYHSLVKAQGKAKGDQIVDLFLEDLAKKLKIGGKDVLEVVWASAYYFARKR